MAYPSLLPFNVTLPSVAALHGGAQTSIVLHPSLMTLIGPNGTGKTQMLRSIFAEASNLLVPRMNGKKTRFLAAGRGSPFERYRADVEGPSHRDYNDAAVGSKDFLRNWNQVESVTGDYLALEQRPDLLLKVEARLQQLFSRSLTLTWNQNGLAVSMTPMAGGATYSASHEASGILQLVALLAAIHNDEIGVLAIDEPEISLHPQHQAFLLREMIMVAGDPTASEGKKLILIATHSPSMLPLKSVADLPCALFFSEASRPPVQPNESVRELKSQKVKALIARLGATHRLAFFANTVLLVEGPSDEIISMQLAERVDHLLLAQNAQVVPVTGKGEFVEVSKLFRAIGKRVVVLADLDAMTDSNDLVNFFSSLDSGNEVASASGHDSIVEFDSRLRTSFHAFIHNHWAAIEPIASAHAYWRDCPASERTDNTKRRAALACLLSDANAYASASVPAGACHTLRSRFVVLLDMLEKVGCHFLRRGTIESYFFTTPPARSKPEAAAIEGSGFADLDAGALQIRYADVLRAISHAAPLRRVDEAELLREKLAAALGAVLQFVRHGVTDEQIAMRARSVVSADADIFGFENISAPGTRRVRVSIRSPLFYRDSFPFEISDNDNQAIVVRERLA